MALAGRIDFNPLTDELMSAGGKRFKLQPPEGDELPKLGFDAGRPAFIPPSLAGVAADASIKVSVEPKSSRLQLLDPFPAWDGKEFTNMAVILKVKGKVRKPPLFRCRGELIFFAHTLFSFLSSLLVHNRSHFCGWPMAQVQGT
jgi:hypothetical protein